MSRDYHCPMCQAALNPDRSVILLATHDDTRALIGFHPQPGQYEIFLPPGVQADAGSRWNFACPVCQADLTAEENKDLCQLELWADGERSRLLFSRVAGEQATFVMRDGELEEHGSDALIYGPLLAQMKYIRY